ncbi:unnamed protein product [Owenia fusiformis]|uniref:Uncharacterized protein n=1 Tax=Owenia fusiformis TaxID=6347 RepID=A0A8J1XLE4_OWEFU|nr:unnamed protein product [Owenia fusiformis]
MNGMYMGAIFLVILATSVNGQNGCNCAGLPDGWVCESGCKAFTRCVNEQPVYTECPPYYVVESETWTCVPEDSAPPPCGRGFDKNCTGLPDARYPDVESGCSTYYSCEEGNFGIRQPCPDDLVFDVIKQLCNWPRSVCPPCGTGETPEEPCPQPTGKPTDAPTVAPTNATTVASTIAPTFAPITGIGSCIDCANQPDGLCEVVNCNQKRECLSGLIITTTCNENLVVDSDDDFNCNLIPEVCPPCGTKPNC